MRVYMCIEFYIINRAGNGWKRKWRSCSRPSSNDLPRDHTPAALAIEPAMPRSFSNFSALRADTLRESRRRKQRERIAISPPVRLAKYTEQTKVFTFYKR